MTNAALGSLIGVSPSMASRIKNGIRLPGTQTLHQIHRQLGGSLAEMMVAHAAGPETFGAVMRDYIETHERGQDGCEPTSSD